jgi:colicin import membrane protein
MVFRRARRLPGSGKAFLLAVLVHAVLLALIVVGIRWQSKPPLLPPAIQARVMPDAALQKQIEQRQREERERAEQEARKKSEERQRAEQEARKQQEQRERERLAVEEKRRVEQAKLAEQKRQDEAKRQAAAAEKKRKEQQRLVEAQQKKEAEQRRQAAEQGLKEQLAAEEQQRAAAEAQARQAALYAKEEDRYRALMTSRIMSNWVPPPDWSKGQGMECTLRVRLVPTGEVIQVTTTCRNSSEAFERSVRNAVYKSSPLQVPEDRALFESRFREVQFNFHPEGKL